MKFSLNMFWKIILIFSILIFNLSSTYSTFQMEWGKESINPETWTPIELNKEFQNPIVVAMPEYTSTTNDYGIMVWVKGVTNTSFEIKTSDENFAAADTITVHYLVIEEGNWTMPGTNSLIEASKYETNKTGSQSTGWSCPTNGIIINFTNTFNANPLVISTRGSDNNPNVWGNTFQNDPASGTSTVTTSQMCAGLSQSKAISPGTFTLNETIYWIALDEGNGTISEKEYEILWNLQDTGDSGGNWINGYADSPPYTQSWAHTWTNTPEVIIVGQTAVGGTDGSWPVLYDTGNTNDIRMFVDEANERAHSGSESGGGFAFSGSGYYPNTFPRIINPQINDTYIYKNTSIKLNLSIIDDEGNTTISSVIATFLYPNSTKKNWSLSQGYALSTSAFPDQELSEINSRADKILYSNDIKAESNRIRMTSSEQIINLNNTYNISQAFISVRYSADTSGTNSLPNYATAMVKFHNESAINISRYSSATATYVSYSILEAENIKVYPFNATWGSTTSSISPTISPTLPNNYNSSCFVQVKRNTKVNSGDTDCNSIANIRGEITSNTTIRLDRVYNPSGCAGATAETTGYIACFKDQTKVTNFELYHATNTQTDTHDLSNQINLVNSFIISSFSVSDDGVSQNNARFYFVDNDTIGSDRGSGSVPGTLNASVYVIELEEDGSGTTEEQTKFLASTETSTNINFTNSFERNKTLIECTSDIRSGTGTNHNKNWWTYNLTSLNNINAFKSWVGGSGQDVDITCQAIKWPSLTTYDTGEGGIDFSKDWSQYNDIDSTQSDVVDSIEITVNISYYNNSGSNVKGSYNSDVKVELYTSSGWINIGELGITESGLYTITTTNTEIRDSWKLISYRDIRIRSINLDYNSPTEFDEINWTGIYGEINFGAYTSLWEISFNDTSKIGFYNITDIYAKDEVEAENHSIYSNLSFEVWSYKPKLFIINPINNTKIVSSYITTLTWYSEDNDTTYLNTSIYFNGTLYQNLLCEAFKNCSINITNLESKTYNWSVNVTDNDYQNNFSDISYFTNIKKISKHIKKSIYNIGNNLYFTKINIENKINYSQDLIVSDFVDQDFTPGSFNPIYDFLNATSGPFYFGNIFEWNLTVSPLSNNKINYSSTGVGDYKLINNYMVGLE